MILPIPTKAKSPELWAIDTFWPGLGPVATGLGGAPWAVATYRAGNASNVPIAAVGGTVEVNQLDGRIAARLGVGAVNEQFVLFPASPRLARPIANVAINPDTLMNWWEADVRFRSPGAALTALHLSLRKCTSAQTNQTTNDPGATPGIGFFVRFDGSGNLRLSRKRTFATDATMSDFGAIAMPSGMTPTDWLRWGFVIIEARASQPALFRAYLNRVLLYESQWGDDGSGAANNLPDYTDGSNTGFFCLAAQARSDLVAGVLCDITNVRFRQGRYDVTGAELPTS